MIKANSITFDSDGGSNVASQTILAGETATEPTNPTRSGYTFEGWYLGSVLFDFSTPITGDLTLTAKWQEVSGDSTPGSSSSGTGGSNSSGGGGSSSGPNISYSTAVNSGPGVVETESTPAPVPEPEEQESGRVSEQELLNPYVPKTEDAKNLGVWMFLAILSALGLLQRKSRKCL